MRIGFSLLLATPLMGWAQEEINTLDDLNAIRDDLSGSYQLMRDLDFNDPTSYRDGVVNTNWTTEKGWKPIGRHFDGAGNTPDEGLSGTLDGGGHTISNLYIKRGTYEVGLFGYVKEAGIISNLTMERVSVRAAAWEIILGGLVARNKGTITNCHVMGTVTAAGKGFVDAGGLVGTNEGTIEGCSVTGDGKVEGNDDVGD